MRERFCDLVREQGGARAKSRSRSSPDFNIDAGSDSCQGSTTLGNVLESVVASTDGPHAIRIINEVRA